MDLVFNDERLIDDPKLDSQIENEHRHRYVSAARFASGKRVLDAACGSGYGSALLAETAERVVGIDRSREVIDYCVHTYQKENLSFLPMSATELSFPDGSFDLAVSFETIEHLKQADQEVFVGELSRVLTKNGTLIISSPNRALWEQTVNGGQNQYHLHELSFGEFRALLSRHFRQVSFYYQTYQPVSLITDEKAVQSLQPLHSCNYQDSTEACYFIAVCSDTPQQQSLSGVYLQQASQAAVEKQLGFVEMDLYCDCGSGFTEAAKLRAPVGFGPDGQYEVRFTLKQDASALRFDPGERPCTLWDISCSDPRVTLRPINGSELADHAISFRKPDPIFLLEGRSDFREGESLCFRFSYISGTPGTLCDELEQLYAIATARNTELARQYLDLEQQFLSVTAQNARLAEQYLLLEQQHAAATAHSAQLGQQYLDLEQRHTALEASHKRDREQITTLTAQLARTQGTLNGVLSSLSWRVTAPVRRFLEWLRRRK